MIDWLTGKRAQLLAKILAALGCFAYLVELGVGIFGGARVAFWRTVPPGYIKIQTFSRYGGMGEYMKPWVVDLHYWAIGVMIVCLVLALILAIAVKVAKSRKPQT